MKAELDLGGYLRIYRGPKGLRIQLCPHRHPSSSHASSFCGDWCPLFGEPEVVADHTILSLCNKTLTFDTLVDRRIP